MSGTAGRVAAWVLAAWDKARNSVSLALFGGSGALGAGTLQHLAATCPGGGCSGCGNCVTALGAAAGAAAIGVVARRRKKGPARLPQNSEPLNPT
ncbi:MAG: hypothetical protein H3C38_05505 [Rhodospirillales bacterium]|nr:hypothetical protein [Rhodospirillales bacterium]